MSTQPELVSTQNDHEQAVRDARFLAQSHLTTVLSTISKKLKGMPFGSVSPVMLTNEGQVIFYVSDIAQHARNLIEDPRLSITFFNQTETGDQNSQGRLTLSGNAAPLSIEQAEEHAERFWRLFPDAKGYSQAHDFRFWQLNVEAARWIGGFGKIYWLDAERWIQAAPTWKPKEEANMVEHMNADHTDACQLILTNYIKNQGKALKSTAFLSAKIEQLTVYPDGCHFSIDHKRGIERLFVPFDQWCNTSQAIRKALVSMSNKARASENAA